MSDQIIRSKWTIKLSLHESLHCFYSFFSCQSVRDIAKKTVRRVRPFCPASQAAHNILGRIGCPTCPDILP